MAATAAPAGTGTSRERASPPSGLELVVEAGRPAPCLRRRRPAWPGRGPRGGPPRAGADGWCRPAAPRRPRARAASLPTRTPAPTRMAALSKSRVCSFMPRRTARCLRSIRSPAGTTTSPRRTGITTGATPAAASARRRSVSACESTSDGRSRSDARLASAARRRGEVPASAAASRSTRRPGPRRGRRGRRAPGRSVRPRTAPPRTSRTRMPRSRSAARSERYSTTGAARPLPGQREQLLLGRLVESGLGRAPRSSASSDPELEPGGEVVAAGGVARAAARPGRRGSPSAPARAAPASGPPSRA